MAKGFVDRSERRLTRGALKQIANSDFGDLMDLHEEGHDVGPTGGRLAMRAPRSEDFAKLTVQKQQQGSLTPEARAAAEVAAHKAELAKQGRQFGEGVTINGQAFQPE